MADGDHNYRGPLAAAGQSCLFLISLLSGEQLEPWRFTSFQLDHDSGLTTPMSGLSNHADRPGPSMAASWSLRILLIVPPEILPCRGWFSAGNELEIWVCSVIAQVGDLGMKTAYKGSWMLMRFRDLCRTCLVVCRNEQTQDTHIYGSYDQHREPYN